VGRERRFGRSPSSSATELMVIALALIGYWLF
jgi:hypothetical protein